MRKSRLVNAKLYDFDIVMATSNISHLYDTAEHYLLKFTPLAERSICISFNYSQDFSDRTQSIDLTPDVQISRYRRLGFVRRSIDRSDRKTTALLVNVPT